MTTEDWTAVIDQATGLGTRMIQFIGEPTLHRALPDLVGHALGRGLRMLRRIDDGDYPDSPNHSPGTPTAYRRLLLSEATPTLRGS